MQCQAKSKSTGEQCRRYAVSGRRVCTVHGGLTPRGFDHPATKTGLYSKHLPTKLAATYEQQLKDSNLLDLKDQVSLIDSRTVELLGKLDTGESKATWVALKKHIDEAVKAAQASNVEKLLSSLFTMQSLITVGNRDIETWTEIYEAVNLRKSLAETERRLLMQGDQLMTAEQALLMITGIISIVRTYVTDPETMLRISNGVERLIIAR